MPALLKNSSFMIHCHGILSTSSYVLRFSCHHHPLRYSSLFTSHTVTKMGLILAIRSILLVIPFFFTLKKLKYCQKNLLSHSYCLHQDTIKPACSDNKINVICGFFVALCTMLDAALIVLSYVLISKIVLTLHLCRRDSRP